MHTVTEFHLALGRSKWRKKLQVFFWPERDQSRAQIRPPRNLEIPELFLPPTQANDMEFFLPKFVADAKVPGVSGTLGQNLRIVSEYHAVLYVRGSSVVNYSPLSSSQRRQAPLALFAALSFGYITTTYMSIDLLSPSQMLTSPCEIQRTNLT